MSISFSFTQSLTLSECVRLNEFWSEHPVLDESMRDSVLLVMRALSRASREFGSYQKKQSGLSAVRKYHKLLCDELDSFALRFMGGGTRVWESFDYDFYSLGDLWSQF